MNIRPEKIELTPDREAAEHALAVLAAWAGQASADELAKLDPQIKALLDGQGRTNGAHLSRDYPEDFIVDAAYRASLPDIQNGPQSLIKGARTVIQDVGISNFRLPISYHTRDGGDLTLETSVTGHSQPGSRPQGHQHEPHHAQLLPPR